MIPKSMNRTNFLILALLCWMLSACTQPTQLPENTAAITVTDALDRITIFDEPPQRIVIAGKANFMLNDAVYLFPEARERVIGLTKAKQNNDFIAVVEPKYEEKLRFTLDSGAEEIAAAHPDLVIMKHIMASSLGKSLEMLDIPVLYLNLETPAHYQKDIVTLGQVFDNSKRASEIWNYYQTQLETISEVTESISESEQPQVLLLQYTTQGASTAFKIPPASWIQTQMTELAGGIPVWKEDAQGGWAVVNFEQIAAWNPEMIFIISYFHPVDESISALKNDAKWQNLQAVAQGNIYGFPRDYYSWDQPDTRWILGLTWLASNIHPTQFKHISMSTELYEFYEQLYEMDSQSVGDKILPHLQGLPEPTDRATDTSNATP